MLAVSNENREQGMEAWYKYRFETREIDLSKLPMRPSLFSTDYCIDCGDVMKCGEGPFRE